MRKALIAVGHRFSEWLKVFCQYVDLTKKLDMFGSYTRFGGFGFGGFLSITTTTNIGRPIHSRELVIRGPGHAGSTHRAKALQLACSLESTRHAHSQRAAWACRPRRGVGNDEL